MTKYVFTILFCCSWIKETNAQCCSAGSPTGGTTNAGSLLKNSFQAIAFYQHSYSNKYFQGDKKVNSNLVKYASFDFVGLSLAYGITDKLTTELEPGFYASKKQVYNLPPPDNALNGYGLSDLTFQTKFAIVKDLRKQFEITPGIGFRFPPAFHAQIQNNVQLPQDVQPSSNAFAFVGSLFLYKGIIEKKINLFWINRVIIPTSGNEQKFQSGNAFISSFFFSYSVALHWSLIAQVRNEYRARDIRNNLQVAASGSEQFYFSPQINYNIAQKWNISLLADIPVYQYYNGTQLAKIFSAALILNRTFDLSKNISPIKDPDKS